MIFNYILFFYNKNYSKFYSFVKKKNSKFWWRGSYNTDSYNVKSCMRAYDIILEFV